MYHNGTPAPNPEALMRSRYSAYALDKSDYIMQTTHPESPHWHENRVAWLAEVQAFSKETRFEGLKILSTDADTVTFHAILFHDTEDVSYTECSLFRQKDGCWLYVEEK